MKSISLYVDKDTCLTRLHPFTKLFYVFTAIAFPLLAGPLVSFLITVIISVVLLISGGVLKKALPLLTFVVTVIITIFLIQGLFYVNNEQPLFFIGPLALPGTADPLGPLIFYREGVLYAARIGLNLLNMLLAFLLLFLTTSPFVLVEELERAGMSGKAGYVIISVFMIVPQMVAGKNTIADAQRSRGLETEGRFLVRVKAFLPLIFPMVAGALINTRERAMALEVRGFDTGAKKIFLGDRPRNKSDFVFTALLVAALLAAAIWRVRSWLI